MIENRRQNDRLDSWKAIAAYLGRDVRTATRWELGRGLPIRRVPGNTRSAVYAYKHEIDAWLKTQTLSRDLEQEEAAADVEVPADEVESFAAPLVSVVVDEVPASHVGANRRWLQAAVAAFAVCVLAVFVYFHAKPNRRHPTRVAFTSDSLQAWDDDKHLLWEHRFEQPLANSAAVGDVDPTTRRPFGRDEVNRASFHDLNGDGRQEILATTLFRTGESATDHSRQVLWCFDPAGRVLWKYEPQTVLHFGGKTYGPPWELSQLIVSDEPGRKTIWIDVVAYGLGKAFLARLDADGHDSVQLVNSGETAGE